MSDEVLTSEIDCLPEPAASLARQIVADLIDCGHPPESAPGMAALQAAAYVSERAWDATITCGTVLKSIDDAK